MTRRKLVASAGATAALSAAPPGAKPAVLEITRIQLRNGSDNQAQRTSGYLEKTLLPALKRAGAGVTGVFTNVIAPDGPYQLVVTSHASLAAMEATHAKVGTDAEYLKGRAAFNKAAGLNYVRYESSLLRAFGAMPAIEVTAPAKGASRIFELRVYESNNGGTLADKIKMFEEGEIAIFRKTGLTPVFFGQTIVGRNQPNLTYMLVYDDLAAREKNWKTFVSHPDWLKLRAAPGWSDSEIVSNISNTILRPLPFSEIK